MCAGNLSGPASRRFHSEWIAGGNNAVVACTARVNCPRLRGTYGVAHIDSDFFAAARKIGRMCALISQAGCVLFAIERNWICAGSI